MKKIVIAVTLLIVTISLVLLPSMPIANSEVNMSLTPTSGFDSTLEYRQVIYLGAGAAVDKESSTVINPKYPSSAVYNDLALLQVVVRDTSTAPNTPSGWTLLFGPDSTEIGRQWIYYRFTENNDGGKTVTVSFSNEACIIGRIYLFRNVETSRFTESASFGCSAGSTTINAQDVVTVPENCLAVAFVFVTDNLSVDSFSSETSGDWSEETEYLSSKGDGGCIQLQTAILGSDKEVTGGYAEISSSASWGVRAFALKSVFTLSTLELEKLATSDDVRYQSKNSWPTTDFDAWQGRCLHFDFTGIIPAGAQISSVMVTDEFYRSSGFDGTFRMIMRLWDGSIWSSDYPINAPYSEEAILTEVSSFINTAEKANSLKIELKGAKGDFIRTSHDQIKVDITYSMSSYTIDVTQSPNGIISPGTTAISYGGAQDFTVTPDNGYLIQSITVDGVNVPVNTPDNQIVPFTNVVSDHTLTASFASSSEPTELTISVDPKTVDKNSGEIAAVSGYLTSNGDSLGGCNIIVGYNVGNGWNTLSSSAVTDENGCYSTEFSVASDMENCYVAFSASFAGIPGYSAAETVYTGLVGDQAGNLHVVPEYVFGGLAGLCVCLLSYTVFKRRLAFSHN